MADTAGGANIYSQVSGLNRNDNWAPRYIDITSSGIDNIPARNRLLENAIGGAVGTYTVAPNSEFLIEAQKHNVSVVASHHSTYSAISSVPGNSQAKLAAVGAAAKYMRTNLGLVELPANLGGSMVHAKPGVFYYKNESPTAALFTGNVTNTSSSIQYNYYLATKDKSIVNDVETYFKNISSGRVPNSSEMKDLIITSPTDTKTMLSRVDKAFSGEDHSKPMYLASATLTSGAVQKTIVNQLRHGGVVKIGRSGMSDPDSEKASNEFLGRLETLAEILPGKLEIGDAKSDTKKLHLNTIVQGKTFMLSSSRMSNSALSGKGTEATLIGYNEKFVQQTQKDLENFYDFKEISSKGDLRGLRYNPGFINFVQQQKTTNNVDIRIAAQLSPKMRQTMLKSGISHQAINGEVGGILTSAFLEYNSLNLAYSEKDAYRYAFYSNDYGELKSIQQDWFTKITWGETWGQLGNRGLGSTLAIKGAEFLDEAGMAFFKDAMEGSAKRFYTYYKPKPLEHSTVLADTVRGGLDYFTNMEKNLLGFHTATTFYSFLLNQGYKTISNTFSFVTGLSAGNTPDSRSNKFFSGAKRALFSLGYISRYAGADVGMSYMSGIASAIDVLTGATLSGSSQLAVETTSQSMFSPRGHRDVNRRAMLTGLKFTQENPFMKATGVSFMMEFYTNAAMFLRTFKGSLGFTKNVQILKTMLLYETPKGEELRAFLRNPAGGLKFSWRKFGSLGLFTAVMFDQYTAYLGENMGGIDKLRVDRANEILRTAAKTAGYDHPVQIARTSNVGMDWTGNSFINTAKAVSGTLIGAARSVGGFISKLWDSMSALRLTEILGPDIIQKGREMEAAQKAALMGNARAAVAYTLLSNQGAEGFRNRAFYGDMWRTWVFQVSPQPLSYTFTWSMVRHKASDSITGNPEEVEEFGFTLQGPVALKIGISVDLPFRFRKQLDNPSTLSYEPWAFEYKPGSSFVNALGAVSLLNTLDITFRGVALFSSKIIGRVLNAKHPFVTGKAAGALEYFGDVFEEFANHDHRFMVDTNKVGTGGAKLVIHNRPGAFRSSMRILSIPVTMPIQAAIMTANMLLGAQEQLKWRLMDKIGADAIAEYSQRVGSSQAKSLFGQLWESHVSNTLWVNHNARAVIRAQLDIQDIDTFEKHFGSSTEGLSQAQKAEYRAALEHKFDSYKRFISPLLRDMTIRNPWNLISFVQNKHIHAVTKSIAAIAHTGLAVLALTPLYFAYEANKGLYNSELVKASAAYTIGNKLVHWAASKSHDQVNALAYETAGKVHPDYKVTTFYKMISGIDYVNAPNIFRGFLALVRTGLLLFDTSGHAGIPNIAISAVGALGELGVISAAGGQQNVKFDPLSGRFKVINSSELYRQTVLSTVTTWATGIIQSFAKGFYHPLGQDQYVMVGSFGITKSKTDKDTEEFAGTFAQGGILLFMQSGYAEKLVLTEGFEKRAYAQWKVSQQLVYSSMGLRMRIRDRQIRTGKMYHSDVTSQATTLGLRTELARRSELFKWVRHVDPADLVYVPGLVSAARGSRIPDKISIRRFKDPVTKRQDNLQKILGFLSDDLIKAGNTPGQFEEYDDQVIFQSAVLKNSEYLQKMGGKTPTSKTPENLSFMSGAAFATVVTAILILGPLKLLGLAANTKLGKSVYETARTGIANLAERAGIENAKERLGAIKLAEEELQLQRLRKINSPAKMIALGRLLEAFEFDGNLYAKGERALYGSGADAELELDRNTRDLRRVFWVGDEFKHGATLPMYRMLNRYIGLTKDFAVFHSKRSMRLSTAYERITRLRTSLSGIKSELDSIKQALSQLDDVSLTQTSKEAIERLGLMTKGIEEGFDDVNKIAKSLEDIFKDDPRAVDKMFKKGNHLVTLLQSNTDIDIISALSQAEEKLLLKGMPKELIKIMEDTGQIKLIGPLKSNSFRDFLQRFGVPRKDLDRFREFSRTNVEYMLGQDGALLMDSPSRATSSSGGLHLEFLDDLDKSFQQRFMGRFLKELNDLGLKTSGQHLMDEMLKVMRNPATSSAGLIEQMMVNAAADPAVSELMGFDSDNRITSGRSGRLNREQLIKFIRALEAAGKLDPDTVSKLINGRLDKIWGNAKIHTSGELLKKFFVDGLSFRLGPVTFNPSVLGAIGRLANPVFFQMSVASPLQEAAYYADLLKEPTLRTVEERDKAAKRVTESYDSYLAGFAGFVVGSLATTGPVLSKLSAFARAIPLLAGAAAAIEAPGVLLGLAISIGIGVAVDFGVRFLLNLKSDDTKIKQGYDSMRSLFLSWVNNSINKPLYNIFEESSRKLEQERYTNKNRSSWSVFWDWAVNGDYDPTKYERPRGGMIRNLLDAIYRGVEGLDLTGSGFPWRRIGGSRSIDPRYSDAVKHSVIWIGNAYDLIKTEIAKQSNLISEGADAFAHTIMHTSMFGMLSPSKVTNPNKDGSDPLGPAWMRDDYRSQLFRPVSGVNTPGLEATLKMRGDFHIQVLSNLVDQRIFMANYMTKSPEYDPRSGAGLPPDAFLLSVIDPTRAPLVIAQPRYSHPALNDKNYNENIGTSKFRDKIYNPVSVGRPKAPKVENNNSTGAPKKSSTSVKTSSQPIMSALEIKVDPLVRALRIAATKLEKKRIEAENLVATNNENSGPTTYMVPATSVKSTDPHIIASDTSTVQQRRGNLFATRPAQIINSGVMLNGYLIHDNLDIEMFAHSDTACTGTNHLWQDTIG